MKEAFSVALTHSIQNMDREPGALRRLARTHRMRDIANSLFDDWYHAPPSPGGGSYYFLFKKNIFVTNISFAELAALIRLNLKSVGADTKPRIQFTSSKELKETFYDLLTSYWDSDGLSLGEADGWLTNLIDRCYPLFSSVVLLDPFYSSSVIHVPRNLEIDLGPICGEAGFIHSCGEAIYVRKVTRSSQSALVSNLRRYAEKSIPSGKQVFLAPYSHEHFSEWDEREEIVRQELKRGLSDVKLYLDKYFFDGKPLPQALREIVENNEIREKYFIPLGVSHYHQERLDFNEKSKALTDQTIFILVDHSIKVSSDFPGEEKYYVVYAQKYKNSSPLSYFEEEKPAWMAPITLPQTLAAAMLNIARPYVKDPNRFTVCDPFLGTGTTLFEAIKIQGCSMFEGGDKNALTGSLLHDNAEFLSYSAGDLADVVHKFSDLHEQMSTGAQRANREAWTQYRTALNWIMSVPTNSEDNMDMFYPKSQHHQSLLEQLKGKLESAKTLDERLLFYLVWRAAVKNWYMLGTRKKGIEAAVKREISKFLENSRRFHKLRAVQDGRLLKGSSIAKHAGAYSIECTIPPYIFEAWTTKSTIREQDAVSFLSERSGKFDVVITDPPYGFNVDTDSRSELAQLYTKVIPAMVGALKDEGQLLFCLPDSAKTGQVVPSFAMQDVVGQEVLLAADQMGREVIRTAEKKPYPPIHFEPPYYWQSERALRRSILHFRIRKRPVDK